MNAKKTLVLGLGTLVLAAVMFFKPFGFLENLFYDGNFMFSKAKSPGDSVIVVGIDAESISGVGTWPWSRSTIAAFVNKLNSYNPRVVALDILFPPKREDPAGNDSLATAFSKVHKLILPFRASSMHDDGGANAAAVPANVFKQRFLMVTNRNQLDNVTFFSANRIDASDDMFTKAASQSGVINVTTSKVDQKLREIVHVIRAGDEYYPSFGLCAVSAFLGIKAEQFALDGKPQVKLGDIALPISSYAGSVQLHFRGRAGTVPTIPAQSVLNGTASPELLKDKLVFVGVTDAGAGADFFTTPVGSQFPGVELWATSALDILQKSWMSQVGGMLLILYILVALFLFPGIALIIPSKYKALSIGLGLISVIASIAISKIVFSNAHMFWDPSSHVVAWVFSVLFVAVQKGAPSLIEFKPLSFDVPQAFDKDMLPSPQENDFLHEMPRTDTASFIVHKLTITSPIGERNTGDTYSGGTQIEEHMYSPDGAALAAPSVEKPIQFSPEQSAQFGSLCGGRIVRLLGSGGMADVYLVWNPRIEMYRAVKVIKPGQPSNLLARFETEIRILSKLAHPHIVQFYNVGEWYSLPYIEMEFIPGAATEDVLKKCIVFTPAETAAIGIIVCRALEYAHKTNTTIYGKTYKGVIHRDLKPANILMSKSGRIKLTDFGIARPQSVSLHTIDTCVVVGTLPYLAPEQLSGEDNLSSQVDIYALGATLYEFLTGSRAFPQNSIPALLNAKSTGQIKPISATHIPKAFMDIINKSMSIKPSDRYESAAAMEKDLEKMLRIIHKSSGYDILAHLVKRYAS
jgi:serine/threonine-protein kinase